MAGARQPLTLRNATRIPILAATVRGLLVKLEVDEMPKVHNKYARTAGPDAVYIGRGSPYGNPWKVGVHGTRDEVCDAYEQALLSNPELVARVKSELKGKDLVCFCAPKRCHGDTLLRIANED